MRLRPDRARRRETRSTLAIAVIASLIGGRGGARGGWVDPDTPEGNFATRSFVDDRELTLVMSDEFSEEGRTFGDGEDPKWTSVNKNDYTNSALHYYSDSVVRVHKGKLNISTLNEDVSFKFWDDHSKGFKSQHKTYVSGMLQSWNKFCFVGGVVEVSASLPGDAYIGGLWPAIWLLGNLARATYTSSSDFMWPWSYNKCDLSTTEKQHWQYQQEISACDQATHYGFQPHHGRGSPEIDILEAMPGSEAPNPWVVGRPYASHSFQVSPGTPKDRRPAEGSWPDPGQWYDKGLTYGENTSTNIYFYGSHLEHKPDIYSYFADAISANHRINQEHFDRQHIYRVEWQPGPDGFIAWYIDGAKTFSMTAETLERTGAMIPTEPLYVLFNTAVSNMWGFPAPCPEDEGCPCDCFDAREVKCQCAVPADMATIFPAHFLIDWVRVYQDTNDTSHSVGCSTASHPTSKWIQGHSDRYKDPEDTVILKSVRVGGGRCKRDVDCGTHGGSCRDGGTCYCPPEYAGPWCKAPTGFNDIQWEVPEPVPPLEKPFVPVLLATAAAMLAVAFVATLAVRVKHRKERYQYSEIDECGLTVHVGPPTPVIAMLPTFAGGLAGPDTDTSDGTNDTGYHRGALGGSGADPFQEGLS